jgi:hypothetical protein
MYVDVCKRQMPINYGFPKREKIFALTSAKSTEEIFPLWLALRAIQSKFFIWSTSTTLLPQMDTP